MDDIFRHCKMGKMAPLLAVFMIVTCFNPSQAVCKLCEFDKKFPNEGKQCYHSRMPNGAPRFCATANAVHKDCNLCGTICDYPDDHTNCSIYCLCPKKYKVADRFCGAANLYQCSTGSSTEAYRGTCGNNISVPNNKSNFRELPYPTNCKEIYEQCNVSTSGVFVIQPEGSPEHFTVYCNNSIDGGGWTVVQRRQDGSVDFYRKWDEYKHGFGFLRREFWLGNRQLSYLTNQGNYELRIDMNNQNGETYFAKYNFFRISHEGSNYRMTNLGEYLNESTAGQDTLVHHLNASFSTLDRDEDHNGGVNCATSRRGAWWYNGCQESALQSNLNGLYYSCSTCLEGIAWGSLPGGPSNIKYSEMKVRPVD